MKYEIKPNKQYNSNEIYFDGKPSQEIINALKLLRMRWNHKKMCWYGFVTADQIEAAIGCGEAITQKETKKPEKKNKFGVKVGDYFMASWGYEQTNVDYFQVIALVGETSVRVREVQPRMIEEKAVSGMAADRTYKLDTSEILPPNSFSVFIKDQEKGDLKRLKSYNKDGSNPQFYLSSFTDAHYCNSVTQTCYESWYY